MKQLEILTRPQESEPVLVWMEWCQLTGYLQIACSVNFKSNPSNKLTKSKTGRYIWFAIHIHMFKCHF